MTTFKLDWPAMDDVIAERNRQISAEGWTPEHDDAHVGGELAMAASCYAELAASSDRRRSDHRAGMAVFTRWPWDRGWWKPKDRRGDLVRAAALIIAEIDRLDRAAARDLEQVSGRLA